ncbi:putative cytochrome P450 E-class, group I [Triangularia setosa]|uniref:Cytochrome P450 E-class, group I n=1 Tax=Triangularia setosa TaxID=2587417 RepID=A0AAN6W148_9PEZI|nr:putative cytochrome P450 E-class, group I [Podospora setosa]
MTLLETALLHLQAAWDSHPYLLLSIPLVLYLLVSNVKSYFKLRHFNGPLWAHFTYYWFVSKVFRARMLNTLQELSDKYGPICRVGPNDLLVGDFDEVVRINGVRSPYVKSDWYTTIRFDVDGGDSVVSLMDTAEHDVRKAKLIKGYEGRGRGQDKGWMDKVVDKQLVELVRLLREKYVKQGRRINWTDVVRYFSVDVTMEALMGEAWGDLQTDSDIHKFFEMSDYSVPFMHTVGSWGSLRWLTSSWWFIRKAGPRVTDDHGLGKFIGIVKKEVAKRFSDPEAKKGDMLYDWVSQGLTPRECELDLVLGVIASADTVAVPMRTIFLYLITSPLVYAKLKAEITAAIKAGTISEPITNQEALKLPYMQAVIHEGLRMMPISAFGFPKRVPSKGDMMCGQHVPGGTDIFPNNLAIQRSKKVFGDDADVFQPERWLIENTRGAEHRSLMVRHIEVIFGHGRWQCPGRMLAWVELNKIFVELLRNFDFQVANPRDPWKLSVYSSVCVHEFWVNATEAKQQW